MVQCVASEGEISSTTRGNSMTWSEIHMKELNGMLVKEIGAMYSKRDDVLIARIKKAIRYLRKRSKRLSASPESP